MFCNLTVYAYAEEASKKTAVAKDQAMWTVMLYLCGTDLESMGSMATTNLEMISKTEPDSNVNVLIQTGGTKKRNAKDTVSGLDISSDKLQRWSYDKDGFSLVDEQDLASMSSHSTLADFIRWGKKNYPAQKNLLILWDHGGGSSTGLILDELHDNSIMSLDGLERALKNGGQHFDLLMTDTCLMASIETAQAVEPYADYLIASEEVVPGLGSNYEEWLQDLYDEPECGPARLGKNICDATEIMYAETADDSFLKGLTFSVIDLSKISAVADSFNAFMKEVVNLIPDPKAFGKYLDAVSTTDRYSVTEMWDLYDLARRGLKGGIPKKTVMDLENAVDEAVIASIRGSYHPYSHGISAYIAYNDDLGKLDRLARTCKNPWQLAFLDAVSLKWDAPEWTYEITGEVPQLKRDLYTIKFDTEIEEKEKPPILTVNSGAQSGGFVRYELQRYDKKYDSWYSLGESEDVRFLNRSDDDKLTFCADFSGRWPAIGDEFLHISTKDVQKHTVLMQASVYIPDLSNRVKSLRILAEYPDSLDYGDEEEEEEEEENKEHIVNYEVEGVWDGYDSSTGLADRNTYTRDELTGFDLYIANALYSDYHNKVVDMEFFEPMDASDAFTVEDKVLPSGKYRIRYSIKDMMDRGYYSDFTEFTWDGKKAVYEVPEEEK